MDPLTLAIVLAGFLFAAFVKGTTGLGFSTSALAVLVLALGLHETLPLLIAPSIASNLLVMKDAGHFRETLRRFWPMYLATLPGLVLGLVFLAWADPLVPTAVLGAVLMLYSAFSLRRARRHLPTHLHRPLAPATGLVTGFINGWTGSQVMPVLPYLMALGLDPNRFVQAINISFTIGSLVMAVGLSKLGLMTGHTALMSLTGIVPVFIGVRLGTRARNWLSPEAFRRTVLLVLLCLGASLILRAVL
ncbi:MAG: sulfite exporter TauE/SafE family protein [Rhodospirillaceae bacterium]|nr:sulfite exporter TauE/SafE family protein [Rhodospirillaceae bacterium]